MKEYIEWADASTGWEVIQKHNHSYQYFNHQVEAEGSRKHNGRDLTSGQKVNIDRRGGCINNIDKNIITQSQIKYVVAGPVPVPVLVNLTQTATLFTVIKTTSVPANNYTRVPANNSTSVPTDPSNPLYPAHVPTTTTTDVTSKLILTKKVFMPILLQLLLLHLIQQLPLMSMKIFLLMLSLNLIQPPPHAFIPIILLKIPMNLIRPPPLSMPILLLKIPLYLL